MLSDVLPSNATDWERALADALDTWDTLDSPITAIRGTKIKAPPPSFLPFLVYEYGLGELTPYVPNLYTLVDQGLRWQRLRGTVSAVALGLGWLGYAADIEEAWTVRRFWNSFQLRFPVLPVRDVPDLERVEGVANLSVPKRSWLRRGVFQYDVGPFEADNARLDGSMLEVESGIAITPQGAIWSFGRSAEFTHAMTQVEGEAIGNWVAPVDDTGLLWSNINLPWSSAEFLWTDDPGSQRRSVLATWFVGKELFVRFKAGADVIGYRRCRAVHAVRPAVDGPYEVADRKYDVSPNGTSLYAEAMTQFGDADGLVCTEVALLVNATRSNGVKPGKSWLMPAEITGGVAIAAQLVTVPLRRTVRDQIKFHLRF